ncbi:hypothetical protein BH09DEP1_BH09DEP1_1440 [soil metagenome]
MVYKRLFHSALIATGILACAPALSMEGNLIEQIQAVDYEESRDLAAIEAIFKSDWNTLEASRPFDPTLAQQCLEPWPHGGTTLKLRKVLRLDNQTIGFVTYYFQDDPETPGQKMGGFEVGGIASEYRKKGLATHFLAKAIEDLKNRGAKRVNLAVKKDNLVAQTLYNRLGFEITGEQFKGIAFSLRKKI